MTDEEVPTEWRREELARPPRTSRLPWLAVGAVATATLVAATTLVLGIGDTLSSRDRSAGRLLPLPAASPSATASPSPTPDPEPPPPEAEPTPAEPMDPPATSVHDALLKLRRAVDEGVAAGDVRDDVGLDLANVIDGMLDQGRRPREHRRRDVAYLQHKIATRTREGGISGGRAEELHLILDHAEI
jgi:pyruvate/2-oxoglutarate dehydrogenase complex dihydrolipoamide acyltransferase (E2) component